MKLIIVESPAKAKKIQTFFPKNVIVRSSFGHINGLDTGKLDEMIEKDFKPIYKISNPKVVQALKSVKTSDIVLAADDDREGDAIAWHTGNLFKLDYKKCNRIKFNEISKSAILNALENPTTLDMNSVNAQRARQFIDLYIGYKVSPLLWKHIVTDKKGLSAGRVQSCLLKILKDHEREIDDYTPKYSYKFDSNMFTDDIDFESQFKFDTKNVDDNLIKEILNKIIECRDFKVVKRNLEEEKSYSPKPLITSTLQQRAQNELGFPVKMTMNIAQKLYENGKITYMRTDSTFISDDFKKSLKEYITKNYGKACDKDYYLNRQCKKVKGAQEAHEAIRPTNLDTVLSDNYEDCDKRLYELIKRITVMSHMKDAIFDVLTLHMTNDLLIDYGYFVSKVKSLKFDGYLKYTGKDLERVELSVYQNIDICKLKDAVCKYVESNPPQYYNESTIVKKLEKSGIGRPSTYANLIDTLYNRNYTINRDIDSTDKTQKCISLKDDDIREYDESAKTGIQKKRIVVTDLGTLVNNYLYGVLPDMLNTNFTANVENDLDMVSNGKMDWYDVIKKIYEIFNPIIIDQMGNKVGNMKSDDKILCRYNEENVVLKNGKYGEYLKYKDKNYNIQGYLKYKKIEANMIKLDDFEIIIQFPKKICKHKNVDVCINIGPYGYYMRYGKKNIKIDQNPDKWTKEYVLSKIG
jgi:DNA topoisomerase-1